MPAAIPLAISALSVGTGIAALGTAATAGQMLLAGATIAGGVLSGVGALTKNERLMKIGAIAGVVGGIGSALSRATAAGAAADAAKATAGNTIADALAAPSPAAANAAKTVSPGLLEAAGGDAFRAALERGNPFAAGMEQISTPAFSPSIPGGTVLGNSALTSTPAARGLLGTVADFGRSVTDFVKKNPEAAKLYSGLIEGATRPFLERQALKDKMEMEKKYQDWVSQKYSDSVRNLVIPPPVGIIAAYRG